MKIRIMVAAAVLCGLGTAAHAESIDVGAATCKQVLELKPDDLSAILMWTHGYFGGKAGDTVIDFDNFAKASEAIGTACATTPDAGWLDTIQKLGS